MSKNTGPHIPAPLSPAIVTAFQRLYRGEAEPHQQQMAIEWLLDASGMRTLSYQPGDTHATAFAEGQRSIGLQVGGMLHVDAKTITQQKD